MAIKKQWLLIKEKDNIARPETEYDIVAQRPESVITGDVLPIDKTADNSNELCAQKQTKARSNNTTAANIFINGQKLVDSTAINTKTKSSNAAKKKKITIPTHLSPTLATLVSEPPQGNWLYEIKFDGYRMLARVLKGEVNLFTRTGKDWTERLPLQVQAIKALKLKDSWLDGEVVILNEKGLPSFQALQNAFDNGNNDDIVFYLFDAPFLNGTDLRTSPIELRKNALKEILSNADDSALQYSSAIEGDANSIVKSACALSLEGVIGKRLGSAYVSRRSTDWIKLKCRLRQEFVIVGYTEPKGSRQKFGAILLGIHTESNDTELVYAGKVGTGFNSDQLRTIYNKMHLLGVDTPTLASKSIGIPLRTVHWIKPQLVCEVEFAEWTAEGVLRQAAFISLREDKPPKNIIRERALPLNKSTPEKTLTPTSAKQPAGAKIKKIVATKNAKHEITEPGIAEPEISGIVITHPNRVLDTDSGGRKIDVVRFYENAADFILPHLSHRPVSLLRAPDGIAGEQFFQKHVENKAIPYITQLDRSLDPGHAPLMEIATTQALIACAQMNTLELHTWGAQSTAIEMPDRLILDLDPDPALPWRSVIEATCLTLCVLDELKLDAFLKTTGGKGMHIVVPLTPDADWEYVKTFSKAISEFMAKQIPERFVAKMGPKNRIGKIFTDYLRNTRGASTVCAYSVRARSGLTVSVPISRKELNSIDQSNYWNIKNLHTRLENLKVNPWNEYAGSEYNKVQKITKAMWKKLDVSEPKHLT